MHKCLAAFMALLFSSPSFAGIYGCNTVLVQKDGHTRPISSETILLNPGSQKTLFENAQVRIVIARGPTDDPILGESTRLAVMEKSVQNVSLTDAEANAGATNLADLLTVYPLASGESIFVSCGYWGEE